MGCGDCKADLARVQHDLDAMTAERDQLVVIVGAAMHVMTPDEFAEVRRRIAERDSV